MPRSQEHAGDTMMRKPKESYFWEKNVKIVKTVPVFSLESKLNFRALKSDQLTKSDEPLLTEWHFSMVLNVDWVQKSLNEPI